MSSPESTGNVFQTPEASPDTTETDLRSLENALDQFRRTLDETVHNFSEYYDHFHQLEDAVFQSTNENSNTHAQVSHNNHTSIGSNQLRNPDQPRIPGAVNSLIRQFESGTHSNHTTGKFYTSGLPLFRAERSFSGSLPGSLSSQGNLSAASMENGLSRTNLQESTTMSGSELLAAQSEQEARVQAAEAEENTSAEWKRYELFAKQKLDQHNADMKKLKNQLTNSEGNYTTAILNAFNHRIHRWNASVTEIDADVKSLAVAEGVTGNPLARLSDYVEYLLGEFEITSSLIEQFLAAEREQTDPKKVMVEAITEGMKDTIQNLKYATNAPPVKLPKYQGDTTKFRSFKKTFSCTLSKMNCPKELWATHLMNSLEGPVKEYIGSEDQWFNNYDALWRLLEEKYGNASTLNNHTIKKFVSNMLISDQPEHVKSFFYDQMNNLKGLLELGLTLENTGVIMVMLSLPRKDMNILKEKLMVLYPGRAKGDYTIDEVRKAFNDTIGALTEEEETKNVSTLSFKTQAECLHKPKRNNRSGSQTSLTRQPIEKDQNQTPDVTQVPSQRTQQNYGQSRSADTQPRSNDRDDYRSSRYDRHVRFSEENNVNNLQYQPRDRSPSRERHRDNRSPSRESYRDTTNPSRGYYRNDRSPTRESYRGDDYSYRSYRDDSRYYDRRDQNEHRNNTGSSRGRGRGRGGLTYNFKGRCYVCLDSSRHQHTSFICPNFPTPALKRQHLEDTGRCNCCTSSVHHGECSERINCLIHNERHFTYLCGGTSHPGKNNPRSSS